MIRQMPLIPLMHLSMIFLIHHRLTLYLVLVSLVRLSYCIFLDIMVGDLVVRQHVEIINWLIRRWLRMLVIVYIEVGVFESLILRGVAAPWHEVSLGV